MALRDHVRLSFAALAIVALCRALDLPGTDDLSRGMLLVNVSSRRDEKRMVEASILFSDAMAIVTRKDASPSLFAEAIDKLKKASDLGHTSAAMEAARALFFGNDRVVPDFDRAASFLDAPGCIDPECHFLLGLLHNNGLGGKKDSRPHALAYYSLAARQMNAAASIALGYIYGEGQSVERNCIMAVNHYFSPASQMAQKMQTQRISTPPRMPRLSLLHEGTRDSRDIIEFYQFNSDAGDASAMAFLGQVFYLGIGGVQRDLHLARTYFTQAAEMGNLGGIAYLGQMDYYGEALEKPDYRSAYHRFRKSAKENNPVGLNGMGLLYWHGIEVVADKEEAVKYFTRAGDLEYAEASYNLAKLYQEIDPSKFRELIMSRYLLAMQQGSVLAGFELAKLQMDDEANCSVTRLLLRSTLEKHPSVPLIEEGVEYFYAGKHGQAISRFLYMAEQGYEIAQYNLAFVLHTMARKRNDEALYRRALVWWTASADLGHVGAMLTVGDYYYYGLGIGASLPTTAAAYYYAACRKRSPQAAFNLGYLYQRGLGVERDYIMAKRYYSFAISYSQTDEHLPEAWLPATAALYLVRILERIDRWSGRVRSIPHWFVLLATALVFGAITLAMGMLYFGLGSVAVSSYPGVAFGSAAAATTEGPAEHDQPSEGGNRRPTSDEDPQETRPLIASSDESE